MASSIFDQFTSKRKVIAKNKKVLLTTYVPETLPHRMKQINDIASITSAALNGDKPSNIMIYGKTGTGKTAVLNYIGKELKKADEHCEKCQYIYVNCEIVDTPYSVLYNIGNQIIVEDAKRIPFTGWSFEKVYSEIVNYLNGMNKVFLVVLDEVDKLIEKKGDNVFYFLAKINENLTSSKVSLIGISNNLNFMNILEPKARSRMGGESITFPPYTSAELADILEARVKEAFNDDVIDEDVIYFCASIAAKADGDARVAIDLLKTASDIAERNGDDVVVRAHVISAKNSLEFDLMSDAIKTLSPHSKLVLISIILNHENGNKSMTTGDVYKRYQSICNYTGSSSLSQRRVGDLINELDSYGIVTASLCSFGRAGRTKVIELCLNKKNIDEFRESPIFKQVELSKPKTQAKLL